MTWSCSISVLVRRLQALRMKWSSQLLLDYAQTSYCNVPTRGISVLWILPGQLGSGWKNVCTSKVVILLPPPLLLLLDNSSFLTYLWNTLSESFLYWYETMHCCRTADHGPGFESSQMLLLCYALRHRITAVLQWFAAWWAIDIKNRDLFPSFMTPTHSSTGFTSLVPCCTTGACPL